MRVKTLVVALVSAMLLFGSGALPSTAKTPMAQSVTATLNTAYAIGLIETCDETVTPPTCEKYVVNSPGPVRFVLDYVLANTSELPDVGTIAGFDIPNLCNNLTTKGHGFRLSASGATIKSSSGGTLIVGHGPDEKRFEVEPGEPRTVPAVARTVCVLPAA